MAYFAWKLLGLDPLVGSLSASPWPVLGVLGRKVLINRGEGAGRAQIFLTVGLADRHGKTWRDPVSD